MPDLSFTAAFAAGTLSFLSPCVLPLVPGYLSFIGGTAAGQSRRGAMISSLAFTLGFGLVFIALGATATVFGKALGEHRGWLGVVAGVVVVIVGLHMTGVFRLAPLLRDVRLHALPKPRGPVGAMFVGAAFGFGWSPCIGPLLGGILTLAATKDTVGQGVTLLGLYALGLAVPFVLAALALDRFLKLSRRLRPWMPWVERAGGAMLVAFGLLLLTGRAGWVAMLLPGFDALAL